MSRRAIALAVAAVLGLSAVWYVALWSPQSGSLKQARADETAALTKEQGLKAQVASLQAERKLMPAKQAQLAQLDRAIPVPPDLDKLIDDVNAAAVASGVSVASFSPATPALPVAGSTAGSGGSTALNLQMTLNGTFFQLVDFVNRFNNMPRLAVVDGISFSAPDKDGKMSASITSHAFTVAAAPPAVATSPTTASAATKGTT